MDLRPCASQDLNSERPFEPLGPTVAMTGWRRVVENDLFEHAAVREGDATFRALSERVPVEELGRLQPSDRGAEW